MLRDMHENHAWSFCSQTGDMKASKNSVKCDINDSQQNKARYHKNTGGEHHVSCLLKRKIQ